MNAECCLLFLIIHSKNVVQCVIPALVSKTHATFQLLAGSREVVHYEYLLTSSKLFIQ
jgi:hypothetical protein